MKTLRTAAAVLALLSVAPPLAACFQVDCRDWDPKAMPAPPQMQRPPLPAQVMAPGALGWGAHWGLNTDSSITGENEGSTWFRASLGDSGIEPVFGFAGPNFIPYIDMRVQLLGMGWTYGPFATLELGGDLMPSRHIGLAFGAALGPLSPFVSARVGRSLDKNYVEGSAGVALSLRDGLSLDAGVARRLNLENYGDRLANTATLALDWQVGRSGRARDDADEPAPSRRERRARADDDDQDAAPARSSAAGQGGGWPSPPPDKAAAAAPEPAAATASGDPCAFGSTLDAFDPARWEARARCLDTLGRGKEADQARARAKELRAKDQQ